MNELRQTLDADERYIVELYRTLNADGKALALENIKSAAYNPAFQGHSARRFDPPALRAIQTDGNVRTGGGQEDQRAADGLQAGKIIDLRSRAAEV